MLLAKTPEEAFRVLNETDFGKYIEDSSKPEKLSKSNRQSNV
jgi:hypothetical protein